MVIPNYSKPDDWEKFNALGVSVWSNDRWIIHVHWTSGIVHGTTITVLNACRKIDNKGTAKLFVTAGLGGMSGAQPKAGILLVWFL